MKRLNLYILSSIVFSGFALVAGDSIRARADAGDFDFSLKNMSDRQLKVTFKKADGTPFAIMVGPYGTSAFVEPHDTFEVINPNVYLIDTMTIEFCNAKKEKHCQEKDLPTTTYTVRFAPAHNNSRTFHLTFSLKNRKPKIESRSGVFGKLRAKYKHNIADSEIEEVK
jgi:hypothetical protein